MAEHDRNKNSSEQANKKERKNTHEDITKSNSDHQNASTILGGTTDRSMTV